MNKAREDVEGLVEWVEEIVWDVENAGGCADGMAEALDSILSTARAILTHLRTAPEREPDGEPEGWEMEHEEQGWLKGAPLPRGVAESIVRAAEGYTGFIRAVYPRDPIYGDPIQVTPSSKKTT